MKKRQGIIGIAVLCLCVLVLAGCGKKSGAYEKGLQEYEAGQYEQAVASFQEAIAQSNTEPLYYISQGMAHIELRNYEEAQKSFEYALGVDEKSGLAYRGKGIAYLKAGDYTAAIEALNSALKCADGHVSQTEFDVLKYRGEAETAAGDYDAAIETYSILLDVEKKPEDNYYLRGNVYALKGEIDLAAADFDKLVEAKPNDYAAYCCAYQSLAAAGASDRGKTYLDAALLIKDDRAVANKYRGMVQYLLGEYGNAVAEITAITGEKDAETLICLGMSYEKLGQQESAYNAYTQALNLENENAGVYNQVGLYKMRTGSYGEALDFFKKGLEFSDASTAERLMLNEALACEYNGDFAQALTVLQEYADTYGTNGEIDHELAFLKTR